MTLVEEGTGEERRGTIYLRPANPEFEPIELEDVEEGEVDPVAELLEVLGVMPEASDEQLAALLADTDERCHELLRGCRQKGLPPPVVGDEVVGDAGRVVAEAELSWREAKVAVLVAEADADRAACEAAGWLALVLPVTAAEVESALRGRGGLGR